MPDTHDTRTDELNPETAPRQPAPDEVLRARPVRGEVNYGELIRDTLRRFPKILAALAR